MTPLEMLDKANEEFFANRQEAIEKELAVVRFEAAVVARQREILSDQHEKAVDEMAKVRLGISDERADREAK